MKNKKQLWTIFLSGWRKKKNVVKSIVGIIETIIFLSSNNLKNDIPKRCALIFSIVIV